MQILLETRPDEGFQTAEFSSPMTLMGYIARHIAWHMRGAQADDEEVSEEWLAHADEAILRAAAVAVGHDRLVALADQAEEKGNLLRAARYTHVASKLGDQGRLEISMWNDLLYKTTDLLRAIPEDQRNEKILEFELNVLGTAWIHE